MSKLRLDGLAIGYPRRALATAIALSLADNEAIAILGPNGCGKTTLLRTVLGLMPALGGEVLLNERTLASLAPGELARSLAYVPQAMAGGFHFTVMEAVLMARAAHLPWYGRPGAHDRDIACQALKELHIADFAARPFTELSGGERQLVMIARALASEAAVMLLDEPTASLDFGNQFLVLDALARLKQRGVAILFTTHHPEQALRIADRTVTLSRHGEFSIGPTGDMITHDALASLYGVDVRLLSGPNGTISTVVAVDA